MSNNNHWHAFTNTHLTFFRPFTSNKIPFSNAESIISYRFFYLSHFFNHKYLWNLRLIHFRPSYEENLIKRNSFFCNFYHQFSPKQDLSVSIPARKLIILNEVLYFSKFLQAYSKANASNQTAISYCSIFLKSHLHSTAWHSKLQLTKLLTASIDKLQANKYSVLIFAVSPFSDVLATATRYWQFIKYKTQW